MIVIDESEIDFPLRREKQQARKFNGDHNDRSRADGELQSSIMSHRQGSGFIDSRGEQARQDSLRGCHEVCLRTSEGRNVDRSENKLLSGCSQIRLGLFLH